MDLSTATLFGVVLLLGFNRAAFLNERIFERPRLFWGVQLTNLAGACYMVLVGVPGFTGSMRVVNTMMGGLLVLHIVVNNRRYAAWIRARAAQVDTADEERRAALAARLAAGGQQDA